MNDLVAAVFRNFNRVSLWGLMLTSPGRKLFSVLAEPYTAGHSLEEGLESIEKYRKRGARSTFDVLGEAATTLNDSNRYLNAYIEMIDKLSARYANNDVSSISVKPTAICAVNGDLTKTLPETPLEERLKHILDHAKDKGINITLDMEDSPWTDESLEVAQSLWNQGYDNLGIVLQSRLYRTPKDIANLFRSKDYEVPKDKLRVRACIGIYTEPAEIATNSKSEAKKRLIDDVFAMYDAGIYVEVATHDHKVINKIVRRIKDKGLSTNMFEFQFLKGVQNGYNIEGQLMREGFKVRYYMPTEISEGDGMPYMKRRLIANPGMVLSALKNMGQVAFNYVTGR